MTKEEEEIARLKETLAEVRAAFGMVANGAADSVVTDDAKAHTLLPELRQSVALFRAVFDGALDAMVLADDGGRYIDVNTACIELFARPRSEIIGKTARDFAASRTEPRWTAFRESSTMIAEYSLKRPDGEIRIVEGAVTANILPGVHLAVLRDVTSRRETELALAESERRFRALIEASTDGIVLEDADGLVRYVSPGACTIIGGTPEDYLGKSGAAFIFHEDLPLAMKHHAALLATPGIPSRATLRVVRKDGGVRCVEVTARNLLHDSAVAALVSTLHDVTERLEEQAVRARLAAMIESSDDAIVGKDMNGVVVYWNLSAERMYGYSAQEAVGMDSQKLLVPERIGEKEIVRRVRAGERIKHHETERMRKDGSRIPVSVSHSPVFDGSGNIVGTASIARDLTWRRRAEAEQRKTEQQLLQSQKMEAVGALAGGVAHDFNNLLSVILSYAEIVLDELNENDHSLRADVVEIQKAAERAAQLTKQLLAFSRKQMLEPWRLELNVVVEEMEKMLRRLIGEDIDLTIVSGENLGAVLADRSQIEQVLLNLVVNARDAMPRGGKITIETSNVELDGSYARQHVDVHPGHYSMIAVTDTGTGMDAETRERIFEPFFTTKEQGKGTGLGLSTVFGIVRQSGGHIWVYSEPGLGSTFKVYLPHNDRTARLTSAAEQPSSGGQETVLLVEDDEQLRGLFCTVLKRAGYTVLDARNGGEALLLQEHYQETIHLLLTDVVMPGISGRVLAERLRPLRPEMRVLYMSGYTDDAIVRHGLVEAEIWFLQKPVKPDGLLRKVREVLDDAVRRG